MAQNANEQLIKNLKDQLTRLVDQLKDLDECREEIDDDEYDSMKNDTKEQLKEFTETLDRMNKGDVTLNNTISSMRDAIRNAIASSFDTVEIIQMFGEYQTNDLAQKLCSLDESYRLKQISEEDYISSKLNLLIQLNKQGHCLSEADRIYLNLQSDGEIMKQMGEIVEVADDE